MSDTLLITIRGASGFGFKLANDLAFHLEQEQVLPSDWPSRFPITLTQTLKMPEINGNKKVARRVLEAAKAVWKDMRAQAIEVQKDMALHPEFYQEQVDPATFDMNTHMAAHCWRHLAIEMEQIAGNLYVTEFGSDEEARDYVNYLLSPQSLKGFMREFGDDYRNFMNELREAFRNRKELTPSIRFDLICSLNANTQSGQRLLSTDQKKATKTKARKSAKS